MTEVIVRGPALDGTARGQVPTMTAEAVHKVADDGTELIRAHLEGVIKVNTGALVGSIAVEGSGPTATIHGDRIIYGAWIEGVGSRNGTSRFKGYHTFREVTQEIDGKSVEMATEVTSRWVGRWN